MYRTRNAAYRKVPWVRIPLSPPLTTVCYYLTVGAGRFLLCTEFQVTRLPDLVTATDHIKRSTLAPYKRRSKPTYTAPLLDWKTKGDTWDLTGC